MACFKGIPGSASKPGLGHSLLSAGKRMHKLAQKVVHSSLAKWIVFAAREGAFIGGLTCCRRMLRDAQSPRCCELWPTSSMLLLSKLKQQAAFQDEMRLRVKSQETPGEHQNRWQMDVHPPRNGAIGFAPWPCGFHTTPRARRQTKNLARALRHPCALTQGSVQR